eukprot:1099338-Rhodomonas_salina.1
MRVGSAWRVRPLDTRIAAPRPDKYAHTSTSRSIRSAGRELRHHRDLSCKSRHSSTNQASNSTAPSTPGSLRLTATAVRDSGSRYLVLLPLPA